HALALVFKVKCRSFCVALLTP
ncbi:DUF3265 domain-containing protein, partial [Vibrio parahaemolyticus]